MTARPALALVAVAALSCAKGSPPPFYCHHDSDCAPDLVCDVDTGACHAAALPLPAPTRLVVDVLGLAAQMSWPPAAGATGYDVLRSSTSKSGPFDLLATVADTSYSDPTLLPDGRAWFGVRATAAGVPSSAITASEVIVGPPPAATGLQTAPQIRAIQLSWIPPPSAAEFTVFRATSRDGPFQPLCPPPQGCRTPQRSFTDTGLGPSETYYYEVQSWRGAAGGLTTPPFAGSTQPPPPPAPASVAATAPQQGGEIDLSWAPVGGATEYRVVHGALQPGSFSDYVSTPSYRDTRGISPDADYFYTVTSIGPGGESAGSVSNTVRTYPAFINQVYAVPGIRGAVIKAMASWETLNGPTDMTLVLLRAPETTSAFVAIGEQPEVPNTTQQFVDSSLGDWQPGCYKAASRNAAGLGPASNPICVTSFGAPDQANAGAPDGTVATGPGAVYGQTFTAKSDGQLIGIEISSTGAAVFMPLTLLNGDVPIGLVSKPASNNGSYFAPPSPTALDPVVIGAGYYDLSRSGVAVSAGQSLRFELPNQPILAPLGDTADLYGGGGETLAGAPVAGRDLVFRTFVKPVAGPMPAPSIAWVDVERGSIALGWTASPGARSYSVERAAGGATAFGAVGTTMNARFTDATVAAGVAYAYRVSAVDANGARQTSAVANATAAGALDQSGSVNTDRKYALGAVQQSFTAGRSGLLTGVVLQMESAGASLLVLVLDSAGQTIGTQPVQNLFWEAAYSPRPQYFDLARLGIQLSAGAQYSLRLVEGFSSGFAQLAGGASSAAGQTLTLAGTPVANQALYFQVYVQ